MKARANVMDAYRTGNLESARLILQDVERSGGPESLAVRWALMVMAKAAPQDTEAGPLFRAA
jgi:hypothetical protein